MTAIDVVVRPQAAPPLPEALAPLHGLFDLFVDGINLTARLTEAPQAALLVELAHALSQLNRGKRARACFPLYSDEEAWEIGLVYDWGGRTVPALRAPGLTTSLLYGEGFDARSVGSGASLPKRREANLSAVWRPPDVPGLQIRAFGSLVHQDDRDRLYHTVGVTIDFELPLF